MAKPLTYIGTDSWSRPVYIDEKGTLWKDTSMGRGKFHNHCLCTAVNNAFDGEPDSPMKSTIEVEFIPERVNTWTSRKNIQRKSKRADKTAEEIEAEFN